MDQFVYPATLTPDVQDGGFVVTFVDVPEAITQGDDVPEALHHAADCLEEAIAGRIRRHDAIPEPSPVQAGQYAVAVPAQTAAKAALYVALRQTQLTQVELAARLQCDEKEVRRLLDPRHASKLSRMAAALALLGQHFVIGVQPISGEKAHSIPDTGVSPTRGSVKGKGLTLACRRPPIASARFSLRLSAAPEAWR
jgi:antitoxin HicB